MKKLILLVIAATLLTSCWVTKERTYTQVEMQSKIDSTAISSFKLVEKEKEVIKNRLITQAIFSNTAIPLECDDDGNVKPVSHSIQSGGNKLGAQIKNNELLIAAKIDSASQIKEKESIKIREADSLRVWNKAKELYTRETEETRVKEKVGLFAHLYCLIPWAILAFLLYRRVRKISVKDLLKRIKN